MSSLFIATHADLFPLSDWHFWLLMLIVFIVGIVLETYWNKKN